MYSTLKRLNHYGSISTTFILILLGLISLVSYVTLPPLEPGSVTVHDLVVQRSRVNNYKPIEDIASLKFDLKTDLTPILNAYNTKQLFVYVTAEYVDEVTGEEHVVTLWDRVVTRGNLKDFRATGSTGEVLKKRSKRSKIAISKTNSMYNWRDPSRSLSNCKQANLTAYYSIMPYVGIVRQGIAATASGPVEIPEALVKTKAKGKA